MSCKIANSNGVQYLYMPDLRNRGIKHFFATRKSAGHTAIPLCNGEAFVMARQVHGDDILIIGRPVEDMNALAKDAIQKPCDAIITNQRGVGIGVVTADCLPVLLYDPERSVIAAVHAGWRGSIKGILSKVVCQMAYRFHCKAEDIVACMGPAIGSCCYAVGEAVIKPLKSVNPEWEIHLTPSEDGKARLDLTALNISQLADRGIRGGNIFSAGLCTACNEDLFFSYRRDGIGAGRMMSGIIMA